MPASPTDLNLRLFLGHLQFQCHVIVVASQQVDAGVNARDAMHVFVHLQSLLNGAASIAKVCWGQGGRRAARRTEIRMAIGISDQSPFRDVSARNHSEHFDEGIYSIFGPRKARERGLRHRRIAG
jgi:hypothetical protein